MLIRRAPLFDKDQTGREMHRLIKMYSGDLDRILVKRNGRMIPFSKLSLGDAYNFVRKIPYRRDEKPIEVVARPARVLKYRKMGMDCKKKAILLSSYLNQRKIPFRLIASSKLPSKRIHHVFPQLYIGEWLNFDATYNDDKPFSTKRVTKVEVLNA